MRVHLKGQGTPIPEIALPDPTVDVNLPSQSFFLEDGVPFLKSEYVADGFTHFEVWCVGAVGGRGGDVLGGRGGAGGGGGLHRVSGLLLSLPNSCPVVVGAAGADGADGTGQYKWNLLRESAESNWYYWQANSLWWAALPGEDGGASSFNGNTCKASGGKGGLPSKTEREWRSLSGNLLIRDPIDPEPGEYGSRQYLFDDAIERGPGGDGGQGGCGGQILAGGGGDGGKREMQIGIAGDPPSPYPTGFSSTDPQDGTWDGAIGKGGGGGWGGNTHAQFAGSEWVYTTTEAVSGKKGSYSYSDTSVYGPGENRPNITTPGSGGGAKINKLAGYGSQAQLFNPNGAVFIRLTKIA